MSCYEWEEGQWKFPCAEYSKFKRTLREAYNRMQDRKLTVALDVYAKLLLAGKGKRNFDFKAALDDMRYNMRQSVYSNSEAEQYGRCIDNSMFTDRVPMTAEDCKQRGIPLGPNGEAHPNSFKYVSRKKPRKPRKNDFPHATNKTGRFNGGEFDISFNDKTRQVIWSVDENNHSCDRAHEHPLAKEFFKALNGVNWTRGTGGSIVGNDEYNRDSRDSGGGGNFNKGTWGPKEQKRERESTCGSLSASRFY